MTKTYYVGCTDYFGTNTKPGDIANKELVPFLKKLKISERNIDEIMEMVIRIADEAWSNGSDSCEHEMND